MMRSMLMRLHSFHVMVWLRPGKLAHVVSGPGSRSSTVHQGVFSSVLISADFKYWFPETKTASISGIVSSCFAVSGRLPLTKCKYSTPLQLGAFFGAIFAFVCGDKLGRKKTIWGGLLSNLIGAVLQIVSWHLPQMIVGRVINGFGMGMSPTFIFRTQVELQSNVLARRHNLVYLSRLSGRMLQASRSR
jgi:MFS family permease